MKLVYYILFLLFPFDTIAQINSDSTNRGIPIGASMISVRPVSFASLIKILNEHNLALGKIIEGKLIFTRPMTCYGLGEFAIQIFYKDSTATFKASYLKPGRLGQFPIIRHATMEYGKPGCKRAFEEMNSMANSLHQRVRYE